MSSIDKWFAKQLEEEQKGKLSSFEKAYKSLEEQYIETPTDEKCWPQKYSEIRGK